MCRFRSAALAAVVVVGFGSVASAADMAVKAPPPSVVAVYNWTGFYGGGNIGYSWGKGNTSFYQPIGTGTDVPVSISGTQNLDGVIGGLQIGYNWQTGKTWVVSLESDFQWSGEKGSNNFNDPYTFETFPPLSRSGTLNSNIAWFGTLRGRAGVLLTPTVLLYGTGGLAYGRISTSGSITNNLAQLVGTCACSFLSFGETTTKVGWTLGAGVEGAIPNTSHWTWKIEYLYIDFGTVSGNGVQIGFDSVPFPDSWSTKVTDNILRVGLNYSLH
jgi:outer membrane immunogenic protein